MSIKEQSCGECQHWTFIVRDEVEGRKGYCVAPIPDSIADNYSEFMCEFDGPTCPVFKRRKIIHED